MVTQIPTSPRVPTEPPATAPTTEYLAQVGATRGRYTERAAAREETRRTLERRGVLYADEPRRVTQRLARLGADWSLAVAVERTPPAPSTGRSLGPGLAAGGFGAGLLGLERLMGRNNLIDVGFLEAGYRASRSVGRITVAGPDGHYGTGFMVSPALLLTNNHVLRDPTEAIHGYIEFNVQAGRDGRPLVPAAFGLEPARLFVTSEPLDFTLVAVAPANAEGDDLAAFGHLPLIAAQGKAIIGELVNIVQHPNGEPKQLALRENRLVDVLENFLHYETDTAPGSSGSPVFNDQWEVVALHHSGVPLTDDQGRYLCADGSPWTPDMGEQRLAWKANEGVRVSRILDALSGFALTGTAADLRTQVFATGGAGGSGVAADAGGGPAANGHVSSGLPAAAGALGLQGASAAVPDSASAAGAVPVTVSDGAPLPSGPYAHDGIARWHIPLRIDVGFAGTAASATAAPPDGTAVRPAAGHAAPSTATATATADEVDAAMVDVEVARTRAYYEAAVDRAARDTYYANIGGATGVTLRRMLGELVESTHERRPAYRPMRLVYPWVDLHPDGRLRSIYSGRGFAPEELIRADAVVQSARLGRWQELLSRESALGPDVIGAELDALEAALPYNCEHVVPQSWFGKAEPMRGDLHHLFACESGCNSFRGNFPYIDFPDREEAVRNACGRREREGFEPSAGKGPAARATLYFLLRYPELVGDTGEFPPDRLGTLLAWHAADPVGEYERHRNFAIAEIQGNRNPLIDHPQWATELDFTGAWA